MGGGYSECKGSEVGIKTREVNREQGGGVDTEQGK